MDFWAAISQLQKHYGKPHPPSTSDPLELILYENIAYLVTDDRWEKAFRELKKRVGTRPADLLTASVEQLAEITALGGIFPELRARRLQESARLARDDFGGDLRSVLSGPTSKRSLKKFPTIGDPGADKILLFTGTVPSLAPESNGLRALGRLGFVKEHKNYSTMYRSAQTALQQETPKGTVKNACARWIAAHQLLKRHGQELCKRSAPRCEMCPLRKNCWFAAS